MKKFLIFSFLLVGFCFIVSAQNASDFKTEIEDGKITITGYSGSVKNIVIPKSIDGIPVVAIADRAFISKSLTGVIIEDGIMTIGSNAFAFNPLTNIQIPDSVTSIGERAFFYQVIENSFAVGLWSSIMNDTINLQIGTNVTIAVDSFNLDFYALYDVMGKSKGKYKFERLRWKTESGLTCGDFLLGFSWDGNGNITIVGYTGNAREIVIPSMIAGITVTKILTKAVISANTTSIVIPDSIISIEEGLPALSSSNTSYSSFITAYNRAEKRAGRYTKAGNTWNYSGN